MALLGAILCAPVPARANMYPPRPYSAKEFTIIKHEGLFHLFYMRRDGSQPENRFWDLGHATSPDLETWTHHPGVLHVRPGHWDNKEIWAPHVFQQGSVFYMHYTAVTDSIGWEMHQRIGLATSTDLFDWVPMDEPVFECADVPWTYCDHTIWAGGEFRDPFVMPDPAVPGEYLMYFVAADDADREQLLVGAGRSTGDPALWSSIGPFTNLHRSKTGSWTIESPTLLLHDGLWYLFYNSWNFHPIQYQTNANPLGAAASWGPQISLDSEVPTAYSDSWFGPETFSDGGRDFFAAVNAWSYSIEFREISWTTGGHFTFKPTVGAVEPRPGAWDLRCTAPSAGWDRLRISIDAPRPAEVRVEVHDASGRLRRLLMAGPVKAGPTRLTWDGTDDRGGPVGSGVYFLSLQGPDVRIARKVVRLR